jgi:predicted metalloprotease
MHEQRRRPERFEDARGSGINPTGRGSRWGTVIGIVIVIAVVALLVFLHLSGTIGPGIHQGG